MHHARTESMTSEDPDHDQCYTDESSNEASPGRSAKRRRPLASWGNVSCQLCKTRKVKCDRTLPSCSWCTRNNAACEYKERKKPGLRAGYGRELEQRLDNLEGILLRHSEILASALANMQDGFGDAGAVAEGRWSATRETGGSPSKPAYVFPERQQETTLPTPQLYQSTNNRRESINNPYSAAPLQAHRNPAPAHPPLPTILATHDRRPSVTFMTNPSPAPTKPSASAAPPLHTAGILHHTSTSPPHAPLMTPTSSLPSKSNSPTHSQDYFPSPPRHPAQTRVSLLQPPATTQATQAQAAHALQLKLRYPFPAKLGGYTAPPLPPWPVLYELAVLYFTHVNAVLPLVEEGAVFEALLNPRSRTGERDGDAEIRGTLMAITIVAMRFLPGDRLGEREREGILRACREELSCSGLKKKGGVSALAMLLVGC